MKEIKNTFFNALILSAFFFLKLTFSFGQGNDLLLLPGSEKLIYNEKTGAQKLIGNVMFSYQGHIMYCDSALYYQKKNIMVAYGKIHINKADSLNLYCDSIRYNGNTKIAKLYGKVRVLDRQYTLTTDSLSYDTRKSLASYTTGGKLVNTLGSDVLTSKIGHFNPKTKNMLFGGNVIFKNDSITIASDTLKYLYTLNKAIFYQNSIITTPSMKVMTNKGWFNTITEEANLENSVRIYRGSSILKSNYVYQNPQKGIYLAKNNVDFMDTTNKIGFIANLASFQLQKGYGYISKKAVAKYLVNKDTIYVHADTLHFYMDSTKQFSKMNANRNAKIFSYQFQGKSDTIIFNKKSEVLNMIHQPILWTKNAELKGSYIDVFLKDSVIEKVEVFDNASAVMELDSGNFYNQIGGKKMLAFFKENELTRLDVLANAQTIYYPEETKESDTLIEIKRSGMMRLYASEIRVYLDSGEVSGVTYFEQPDGKFYPMDQLNKDEQFVKGFSFNPTLRPKSLEEIIEYSTN